MIYLDMKNVRKTFYAPGKREVLKGVSMQVSEGEVVSIIGPSGSGKSTLLRIATFLETMDSGELSYMLCTSGKNEGTAGGFRPGFSEF